MRSVVVWIIKMTSLFLITQNIVANTVAQTASQSSPTTSSTFNNPGLLLGLPPLPIPANNPQSQAKIALGNKLFHDKRFSIDGTVSCANCYDDNKAFTDNLPVSLGNNGKAGTRMHPL
jgi:cytochrome c peroxidase